MKINTHIYRISFETKGHVSRKEIRNQLKEDLKRCAYFDEKAGKHVGVRKIKIERIS